MNKRNRMNPMRYFIVLFVLLPGASSLYAQSSDYEAWRKQKEQAYAKWQKLRGETGDLPTSQEQVWKRSKT
jgi:hypothetical protein